MYIISVGSYSLNSYVLHLEVSGDEAAYGRFEALAEGFDGTDYFVQLVNDETGEVLASTYDEKEDN